MSERPKGSRSAGRSDATAGDAVEDGVGSDGVATTQKTSKAKKKGLGFFGSLIVTLFVLAILGAGTAAGGYFWLLHSLDQPGPSTNDQVVMVAPGSGVNAIAARLEADGLVSSRYLFRAGVTLEGVEGSLKAGEYAIPAGASMREIFTKLVEGDVIEYTVTFAEGLTSAMIVDVLASSDVLEGEVADVPPEGSLLPETYQVVRGTSRQALLDRMAAAQTALIDQLWADRADGLPFETKEEAIILASIVEKETGVPDERGRVAAVFVNRLRRGMRLESDPTIIYGISQGIPLLDAEGQRRGIRRSELDDSSNPYSTYHIPALPPGPICNPGTDSIAAVLNPATTNDIFFVADGSGGHAFAETLAEHNRNVANWRRIERERNGG